jgi:hypothetical protein
MAKEKKINKAEWTALYQLTDQAYELAAWEWLYEDQMFGIRLPDDPTTWYVSIMGNLGEHLCYCYYKGEQGLAGYIASKNMGDISEDTHEMEEIMYAHIAFMRSQNCIQVSYEDEEYADEDQMAHYEAVGLKMDTYLPTLTDWTPGFEPDLISPEQIPTVTMLLQKTIELLSDDDTKGDDFPEWEDFGSSMTIHTATRAADGTLRWSTSEEVIKRPVDPLEQRTVAAPKGWQQFGGMKKTKSPLVIGRLLVMGSIMSEDDTRGYFRDPIVVVDPTDGAVIGMAMGADWDELEQQLLQTLLEYGNAPTEIFASDEWMLTFLQPCLQLAGLKGSVNDGARKGLAMMGAQFGSMMEQMDDMDTPSMN